MKENKHLFMSVNALPTGGALGNAMNSQRRQKTLAGCGELPCQEKPVQVDQKGQALHLTSSGQARARPHTLGDGQ